MCKSKVCGSPAQLAAVPTQIAVIAKRKQLETGTTNKLQVCTVVLIEAVHGTAQRRDMAPEQLPSRDHRPSRETPGLSTGTYPALCPCPRAYPMEDAM